MMELRTISMEYLLIKGRHRDVFTNFEIFYRCKNEKWSFGNKAKKPKNETCTPFATELSRIAINLVRATQHCIQGSRVLVHWISVQRLQWEDGAGQKLFW